MCTTSEQAHIQIENISKAVTKVFQKAEQVRHENLLKIQQRKAYEHKVEKMNKIQRSMVIVGKKNYNNEMSLYGVNKQKFWQDKSLCKGLQTTKKLPPYWESKQWLRDLCMYVTSLQCKTAKNKWTVKFRLAPDVKTRQQNTIRNGMQMNSRHQCVWKAQRPLQNCARRERKIAEPNFKLFYNIIKPSFKFPDHIITVPWGWVN